MRILYVQETDWINRGPHQQHHLMERMAQRGHEVRVIDYDLLWGEKKHEKNFSERFEIIALTTSGITSPARRTITGSPIRTSLLSISS